MIELKPATPVDAVELTDVQMRTFDQDSRLHGQGERGGPPGYDSVAWQIDMMQRGPYFKLVDRQRIIGGAIVFDYGCGHFELGRIYLDPEFQNRGLGSIAMQLIEQQFPAAERWTLDTPRDLAFLRALVARLPAGPEGWSWKRALAVVSADPALFAINAGADRLEGLKKSMADAA